MTNYISNGSDIIKRDVWASVVSLDTQSSPRAPHSHSRTFTLIEPSKESQ